jgi:glycerol-3-phosphate acyltransferase PlsY
MTIVQILAITTCAFIAYLLGSIPTSIWYGLAYYNKDVRQLGSGNAGATNTFRVLGKKAGSIVMLIDVLKGWTAACLVIVPLHYGLIEPSQSVSFKLAFGFLAVLGHIFPIFENFKGGKGVATILGMVLALHPIAAGLCILVFLSILIVFKYVSLGSMIGTLVFPTSFLFNIYKHEEERTLLIIFGFLMFGIVVWAHFNNIKRLLNGQESRTYLFGKKNK